MVIGLEVEAFMIGTVTLEVISVIPHGTVDKELDGASTDNDEEVEVLPLLSAPNG